MNPTDLAAARHSVFRNFTLLGSASGKRAALVQLEAESGKPLPDYTVEDVVVLLVRVLVEGGREVVAQLDELVGARLDQIEVVAVTLLRFVAGSSR